jgi:flagellar biosynthesis protein FlhG
VNLALALAGNDKQVMLLDADLGLANIDATRAAFTHNLSHVLNGGDRGRSLSGPGGCQDRSRRHRELKDDATHPRVSMPA